MKYILSATTIMIALMSATYSAQANDIEHYTLPENRPKNLPFSEAVRIGDTIYLAGQIGIPPGEPHLVPGGLVPETEQTLRNIGLVLNHFGLTYSDVVRCQVMLADIHEWPAFNEVYKTYFSNPYPARSAFGAEGLAFGARVEVECVAVRRLSASSGNKPGP